MKRRVAGILAALSLCFMSMPLAAAQAETVDGLIMAATVQAKNEMVLTAPAGGELESFSVSVGENFSAGDTLFKVKPMRVYADIDGEIAAVYVKKGDIADAATTRYGAVMQIEYAERYEANASARTGYNTAENRDPHVGTQVYLRSTNEKHYADGVITSVSGGNFTVQVIGGDLIYTQSANIYSDPEYGTRTLLAQATLSSIAPYNISASGTITEVAVKAGDTVKAGDYLFSYVPDRLEPSLRGKANWALVKADQDLIIKAVNVQQGASVQKDQVLASAYVAGNYELVSSVEESDVGRLHVGDAMRVSFEELGIASVDATITRIGALGSDGDVSKYTVTLDFEVPEGVLLGMHATVVGK